MMKKFFAGIFFAAILILNFSQADAKINFQYQVHVQNFGWTPFANNGEAVGTTGKSLRLEAILINLRDGSKNMIQYNAHVQNIGWQGWQNSGGVAGTVNQGLRMEAVSIKLVNGYEKKFDIYYRTHVQNFGWLGWAKNGEPAGTQGASLRMEALQITLVEKGKKFNRGGAAFLQKKNPVIGMEI